MGVYGLAWKFFDLCDTEGVPFIEIGVSFDLLSPSGFVSQVVVVGLLKPGV